MLWLFINFVQPHFIHCYLTYTFNYRLVEHPMHIPWKACQERISTYQFWSQLESTPTPLLLLPHFQPWNAPYPIPKFTLPFQCLLEDIPSFWRLILRPIKMVRRMFCVVFSLEIKLLIISCVLQCKFFLIFCLYRYRKHSIDIKHTQKQRHCWRRDAQATIVIRK